MPRSLSRELLMCLHRSPLALSLLALALCGAVLTPGAVYAEDPAGDTSTDGSSGDSSEPNPSILTSSTTTTTSGLITTGGIMITMMALGGGGMRRAALHHYLKHNDASVREALCLGGGAAAQDLALIFERDPADLTRRLRARRHRLTRLLHGPQTTAMDAEAFWRIVNL